MQNTLPTCSFASPQCTLLRGMGLSVLFTRYEGTTLLAYQPAVHLGIARGLPEKMDRWRDVRSDPLSAHGDMETWGRGDKPPGIVSFLSFRVAPSPASSSLWRQCFYALTVSGDQTLPGRLFVA